ncbi:MAG: PAS domain-containing sensor histidine kinase [Patescibacteria group bacterium]
MKPRADDTSQPYSDRELQGLKELKTARASILKNLQDTEEESQNNLQKTAIDEAVLESIGDGLVVMDKLGIITYVNPALERMVGWTLDEIVGNSIVDTLILEKEKGEKVSYNEEILSKVLAGGIVVADLTNPFYHVRKDKSTFPISTTVSPILLAGEIIGAVMTFRDITKEKEIDKAKTEFVSLASHQLRTPLSTINWYTEMLLAGDVGKLSDKQDTYLREIYRGSQRMVSLVNALLSVSRMDLGTFVLEPEPTDFVRLIQTIIREQQFHIERKKIIVTTSFQDSLPLIHADGKLLSMVVQNILSNAVKYTPDNGTIDLTLTLIPSANTLRLKIKDTGYGIPLAQQEQIFTKLFRADNVREKETEGTGLGLYIAKTIIDNSEGRLWFESEENKGTTFYLELPAFSDQVTTKHKV